MEVPGPQFRVERNQFLQYALFIAVPASVSNKISSNKYGFKDSPTSNKNEIPLFIQCPAIIYKYTSHFDKDVSV